MYHFFLFTYIRLTATERSIQQKNFTLYICIYIDYIYIYIRRSELIFRTWARPVQFVDCGVRTCVGWVSEMRADDGRTVSIVKIVSLFPRVENLNLKKVIKVSYLNQESRQYFACFSYSYAYEHSMFYEHYERFYISVYFTY